MQIEAGKNHGREARFIVGASSLSKDKQRCQSCCFRNLRNPRLREDGVCGIGKVFDALEEYPPQQRAATNFDLVKPRSELWDDPAPGVRGIDPEADGI